jgi:3-phenylpropionate/trans-cinnamate dioxygenase ferredoxin component
MPGLPTAAFRAVGQDDAIPDGFVVPFYLSDRKLRISGARAGGDLYVFDDLCTCAGHACPLSAGLLTGTTIMCQCHGSEFDVPERAANAPAPRLGSLRWCACHPGSVGGR